MNEYIFTELQKKQPLNRLLFCIEENSYMSIKTLICPSVNISVFTLYKDEQNWIFFCWHANKDPPCPVNITFIIWGHFSEVNCFQYTEVTRNASQRGVFLFRGVIAF